MVARAVLPLVVLALVAGITCALDNGVAVTPPMGWLSWERYACQIDCKAFPENCIDEKLYMRMADLLVSEGYADLGYEYVNVDDCWPAMKRTPSGELMGDPVRFPSGMKALGDYIHSKGLKFGIYLDIGPKTCAGYPGFNVSATPGGDQQYIKDVETMASWGVDSLKVDGCNANPATMNVTYPKLSHALNETGRPIAYACSWPDYVRLKGLPVQWDLLKKYCNVWRLYDDIQDSYSSVSGIIYWWGQNNASLVPSSAGAWTDADMLVIGNTGLSNAQEQIQMAVWSIMGSPMLMSNDLSKVSAASKAILQNKEAIAVSQDPLGRGGYPVFVSPKAQRQTWKRDLANGDVAVALVHLTDFGGPANMNFTASQIGLPSSTFSVRDIFQQKDLGVFKNEFNINILTSSVKFYRVSAV